MYIYLQQHILMLNTYVKSSVLIFLKVVTAELWYLSPFLLLQPWSDQQGQEKMHKMHIVSVVTAVEAAESF